MRPALLLATGFGLGVAFCALNLWQVVSYAHRLQARLDRTGRVLILPPDGQYLPWAVAVAHGSGDDRVPQGA